MDGRHAGQNARRRGGAGSAGRGGAGRAAGTARFGQKTSAPAPRGTARRGGGGAAGGAGGLVLGRGDAPGGSAAPAQYSLQSAGGAADEGRETEQAPRVAAAQDTAGTASSAAAAPETTEDAQAGARKEGRLLFAAEGSGMGMGDITVRTDADLAGANPTYDLPAGELPTELPVYAAPDGEAEMRAVLEDTAAKLGGHAGGVFIRYLRPAGRGVLQPLCQRQGGRRKLFPKRAGSTFLPV